MCLELFLYPVFCSINPHACVYVNKNLFFLKITIVFNITRGICILATLSFYVPLNAANHSFLNADFQPLFVRPDPFPCPRGPSVFTPGCDNHSSWCPFPILLADEESEVTTELCCWKEAVGYGVKQFTGLNANTFSPAL